MTLDLDDTIAALASAGGPALRGVIRISGPQTRAVLDRIFRPADESLWATPRRPGCHSGSLSIPGCPVPMPAEIYLWPTHRSYTGQPAAELHVVGSPPLLEASLSTLHAHGARPARPGEFTLRAFLAGRVDLVQAEAVLGVIDAYDHLELQTALEQLAGGVSGRIGSVRNELLDLLADLEAGLDFVEEDIEFVARDDLLRRLSSARDVIDSLLSQTDERMTADGRWRLVLAGLSNAGKSTLFNLLTGREAALVSHIAGTTRDYVSAPLDWDGLTLELIDTAGREAAGVGIMQHAQSYLGEQLRRADLILWCSAADQSPQERQQDEELIGEQHGRPMLRIRTKADLSDQRPRVGEVLLSSKAETGLAELRRAIAARLDTPHQGQRQIVGSTASRSRDSLSGAAASLDQAIEAARSGTGEEFVAIELREALEHLARILGAVYTDDILDRIFSKFCIGK